LRRNKIKNILLEEKYQTQKKLDKESKGDIIIYTGIVHHKVLDVEIKTGKHFQYGVPK